MKKFAHAASAKALVVLKNPVLRPVEIWALRGLFAAVAGYLGIKTGVV